MQTTAHIHAIGTAIPTLEGHQAFVDWAEARIPDPRMQKLFRRMASRSGIDHRWTVIPAAPGGKTPADPGGFYAGDMPSTAERMKLYAEAAPELALKAIDALKAKVSIDGITHLVVASCTGFVAPGVDQIIIDRLGLPDGIERTLVGFMGCYAAVSALRVAHHIARSDPKARILVVTVELCSLHLIATPEVERLLAMLQFADGAAAALVSAEPAGIAIEDFFAANLREGRELIRWAIGDGGFEMHLSGEVPGRIATALRDPVLQAKILRGRDPTSVDWALHPGGRSIIDAVESTLGLSPEALEISRSVLARFGNMSSATLMFVLADFMARPKAADGVALAFGPGLAAEGFHFRSA